MSDMAYIMETQDPRELWLVDGEQRMRVSRDMYWLLVSQGADLPPLHDISDLLAKNAALRQQLADLTESMGRVEERCAKLRELVRDMYLCSDPCNDCPHYNGSNSGFYCGLGIGWKARRMREFGIEVDE